MEHLTLKAATAVQTDEGTFTAVISTVAVDRHKDIVDPDGLVRALHKWVGVGKNIPLAWHHSTRPEDIIGHIDPATARNEGGQVVVEGWIDESVEPAGKNAWRLVKSGTLGFSYGFIPLAQSPRKGGGFHIKEADVFEITATPIPANHETRVLGWKSADKLQQEQDDATVEFLDASVVEVVEPEPEPIPEPEPEPVIVPSAEEIHKQVDLVAREQAKAAKTDIPVPPAPDPEPEPEPEPEPTPPPSEEEVRKQAEAVVREQARAAKRDMPPPPPDPMVKAFEHFKPAGKTAEQIVYALDGTQVSDSVLYVRLISADEKAGIDEGEIKAVWSTAYVNNLPDSAFLYVESGTKDSEGKTTPRSKRHFPYKTAEGSVDLPHLRNALARIPQSSLPDDIKSRTKSKAQRILDNATKSVDAGKEHWPSVDPLVKEALALSLEHARTSSDIPQTKAQPVATRNPSVDEFEQEHYELMLSHLRGN
jgi:HK97 family phage prohead protease